MPPPHPLLKIAYPDWLSLKERFGARLTEREKCEAIERASLENEPFRLQEHAEYGPRIESTQISAPPVFVIGHWRSGTTHLQNILSLDERFGYLNVVQSLNPHTFLGREAKYLAEFAETKRMMDNVKLSGNAASEEEVALGIMAPGSFWHGYYVPEEFDYYFRTYTLFEGIGAAELSAWKQSYLLLLKKLTLRHAGKQLILKNPPNTGRIAALLEMFPDARFIHIHRNPYEVYYSRMNQYGVVSFKALQKISREAWQTHVLTYYREMMAKHLRERALVPAQNYAELSFDQLRENPMACMRAIYDKLRLPSFELVEPIFHRYLASTTIYEQNNYSFAPSELELVSRHWAETIDRWSYRQPAVP